jgi:YARHG domain
MRFYQDRVITEAMLGEHSPQDWEVLEAEVLANHGYVFEQETPDVDEDNDHRNLQPEDLQKYFNERYWYQPKPEFTATELSQTERQNLDTIALAIMRQNKRAVSPGVMNLFQRTPLTERMLANVNLADLRLIRNEIYARHGRPFQTPWLAEYFRQEPWYTPRKGYTDADLSPVERANIALIAQREKQLHESLSTHELTPGDVKGLRPDDARRLRNEIYARHGRRFKDPMLQRYFASFAWYKPNASFRESQLTPTERFNADLISQYEHGRFTEG